MQLIHAVCVLLGRMLEVSPKICPFKSYACKDLITLVVHVIICIALDEQVQVYDIPNYINTGELATCYYLYLII